MTYKYKASWPPFILCHAWHNYGCMSQDWFTCVPWLICAQSSVCARMPSIFIRVPRLISRCDMIQSYMCVSTQLHVWLIHTHAHAQHLQHGTGELSTQTPSAGAWELPSCGYVNIYLFMYMYVYIYVHIYIYTYICIYIYIYICKYVYIHIHIYINIHMGELSTPTPSTGA